MKSTNIYYNLKHSNSKSYHIVFPQTDYNFSLFLIKSKVKQAKPNNLCLNGFNGHCPHLN